MLDSEAVLSVSVHARWLYVTILLQADDVGLFEAKPFKLARKAEVPRESAEALLQELAQADLVRLYSVDGEQYGFIPKFNQRLQIKRTKHPLPPADVFDGDKDAVNKINHLTSKKAVDNGELPLFTVIHGNPPPEPEPEPEEERNTSRQRQAADRLPACPHVDIIASFAKHLPMLPQPSPELWGGARAKALQARWRWAMTTRSSKTGQMYATDVATGLAFFERFFVYVSKSDFLTGRNGGWAGCNLGWLLRETNFTKVFEGQYENKEQTHGTR